MKNLYRGVINIWLAIWYKVQDWNLASAHKDSLLLHVSFYWTIYMLSEQDCVGEAYTIWKWRQSCQDSQSQGCQDSQMIAHCIHAIILYWILVGFWIIMFLSHDRLNSHLLCKKNLNQEHLFLWLVVLNSWKLAYWPKLIFVSRKNFAPIVSIHWASIYWAQFKKNLFADADERFALSQVNQLDHFLSHSSNVQMFNVVVSCSVQMFNLIILPSSNVHPIAVLTLTFGSFFAWALCNFSPHVSLLLFFSS